MKKFLVCALVLVICLTAFVACKDKGADLEDLNRAKEFLSTHLNGMKEVTGKDYKLPAVVAIDGVNYTVTWTLTVNTGSDTVVSLGSVENSLQTINIDEFASAEATYTLTATIADENGNTVTVTANRKVPAFTLNTYAEYAAACEASDGETNLTVKGYIIGVNADPTSSSTASIWLMDADGHGYYAYKPAKLDGIDYTTREGINAGFPQGKEIVVKGIAKSHNGCYELDTDCEVIFTGNSVDPATLSYVDRTELFSSASSQTDADTLGATAATRATLNGVTMKAPNDYDYFFELNGIEYICRMNIYLMSEEDQNALMAKWVPGGKANLTGFINVYGGKFQLYPDSLNSVEIVQENLTDEQKVARAKENLILDETYNANFTLPTSTWANVEWAIEGAGATLGENNAVTINQTTEEQTVTITATITEGQASDTKVFTVKIAAQRISFIKTALTAGAALANKATTTESYIIIGYISEITEAYSEQYQNVSFNVKDAEGNELLIYHYNGEDAATLNEGDFFAYAAPIKKYEPNIEAVAPFVALDVTSLATASTATAAQTGVNVYGYVKSIDYAYSSQHNNISVTISDGTNDLYCYRLKGGATLEVGTYIYVSGNIAMYKDAPQIDAGATYVDSAIYVAPTCEHQDAALDGTCDVCNEPYDIATVHAGTEADPYTVADIIKYSKYLPKNGYTANMVYVTGYIKTATFGNYIQNIYLVDELDSDTTFLVYSANLTQAVTAVAIGDKVTIKGAIKNYNGTIELANVKDDNNQTIHGYPTFEAFLAAGQGTITVNATNATVAIAGDITGGANHTTFTFTVTADQGYEIGEVKVNGKAVTANEGVYTGTILGATTISVTATSAAQTTITKTIAELATANSWADGKKYSSFNLDDVISVSASTSGNNGKYYTNGSNYRLYQGDNGTITITAAAGYKIVSVKVDYTVDKTGILTLNGNNVATGTTTTVDGQSITFGVGNTGSATNGQVRVTAITVIYEAVQA